MQTKNHGKSTRGKVPTNHSLKKRSRGSIFHGFWLFFYAPIVNSSYFAFHPSSLAAPAIFYSFLCLQKNVFFSHLAFFETTRWNPFISSAFERYDAYLLRTSKKSEIGRVVLKNELPKVGSSRNQWIKKWAESGSKMYEFWKNQYLVEYEPRIVRFDEY